MLFENDPFRDFESLFARPTRAGGSTPMAMDAYRRGDDVFVHLDLPGVDPASIDVTVERNVLTVTAARGWEPEEGDQIYLSERRQGTFRRQVNLGDQLDAGAIEAHLDEGVLTLRIPVAAAAQPRRIEVGRRSDAVDVTATGD